MNLNKLKTNYVTRKKCLYFYLNFDRNKMVIVATSNGLTFSYRMMRIMKPPKRSGQQLMPHTMEEEELEGLKGWR